MRHLSRFDQLISHIDYGLQTVFVKKVQTPRVNPAIGVEQPRGLSDAEKRLSSRLLRIDETGEVCAQALYQGQGLTAKRQALKAVLMEAAEEENDHLKWCQERLAELDSHTSYLNPVFYVGSFLLGAFAGLVGDQWSLGFLAETERQVVRHLEDHLSRLSEADLRSRAILQQMREDELEHATMAVREGAAELPWFIKQIMRLMSTVMTKTTYWV